MPVAEKRCVLNGLTIQSIDDLYSALIMQLKFPPHFGRNLDALWDVLTTDIAGPFSIQWQNAHLSRLALGQDYDRIVRILRDLEKERSDFKLHLS